MQLLIATVLGIDVSRFWADLVTGGVFAIVAVLSIALSVRDRQKRLAVSRRF